MTTTTQHLRSIALNWQHLQDALGAPVQAGAFGLGLRSYLAGLEQHDLDEAHALRALERDPAQIGERPVPIRIPVYDCMRAVEAALVQLADETAASVQRPAMSHAPHGWPASDRARRNAMADADAADPRRWRYVGHRTAIYAALWLLARVQGGPGPFIPLTEPQRQRIANVAQGAAARVERTLDTGSEVAELSVPCRQCGGTVDVHGGAGASPIGHCRGCGHIWAEGVIAA